MKVVVTGGSGRLGRWLVPELVRQGHELTVCDLRIWLPDEDQGYREAVDHPEQRWKGLWVYVDVRDVVQAINLAISVPELPPHSVCYVSAADVLALEETLTLLDRFHPNVSRIDRSRLTGFMSVIDGSRAQNLLGYKAQYSWHDYLE